MCNCKQLLGVLFIVAAILAVIAARVDLKFNGKVEKTAFLLQSGTYML